MEKIVFSKGDIGLIIDRLRKFVAKLPRFSETFPDLSLTEFIKINSLSENKIMWLNPRVVKGEIKRSDGAVLGISIDIIYEDTGKDIKAFRLLEGDTFYIWPHKIIIRENKEVKKELKLFNTFRNFGVLIII